MRPLLLCWALVLPVIALLPPSSPTFAGLSPQLVTVRQPSWVPAFCQKQIGLRTNYTRGGSCLAN